MKDLSSSIKRSISASNATRCVGEEDEAVIREDDQRARLMKRANETNKDEGRSLSAGLLLESP